MKRRPEREIILDKLRETVESCQACVLRKNCERSVMGDGNPFAEIMFVGANPSFSGGNITGKNFTGVSGRRFFSHLADEGIDREECYVTNVLKCAAYINSLSETQVERSLTACRSHFLAELSLIKPRTVIILGTTPFYAIMNIFGCNSEKFRPGDCIAFEDFDAFMMNHPSYYINHGHEEEMKDHVAALKKYLAWRVGQTKSRPRHIIQANT
jgi:uracil-DNA glycosylase